MNNIDPDENSERYLMQQGTTSMKCIINILIDLKAVMLISTR